MKTWDCKDKVPYVKDLPITSYDGHIIEVLNDDGFLFTLKRAGLYKYTTNPPMWSYLMPEYYASELKDSLTE